MLLLVLATQLQIGTAGIECLTLVVGRGEWYRGITYLVDGDGDS